MGNFWARLFGNVITKTVLDTALTIALARVSANLDRTDKLQLADKDLAKQLLAELIAEIRTEISKV